MRQIKEEVVADKKTKSKTSQAKAVKAKAVTKAKPAVKASKVDGAVAKTPKVDKKTAKLSKRADKKLSKKARKTSRKVWKPLHILGLIFWPRFIRNSFKELHQVTWLSLRGSVALTAAVLFFAVIFVVFIGLIDMGLDRLFKALFLK